jgi:hypothetical protein
MSTLLLANGCDATHEQHVLALETAVRHFKNRLGLNQLGHVAARYKLVLDRVREQQGRFFSMRFQIRPLVDGKDDVENRTTHYKHPKGAIAEIKPDPGLVYRGMSWEEWMLTRKRCEIRSMGGYNIGQKNYTFFGAADTAAYYASGFTPWIYKPAMGRPGVVIGVEKEDVLHHKDRPDIIPEGEYAIHYGLPARRIQEVYILVAKEVRWGFLELELDRTTERISEASASGVSVWPDIVQIDAYQARADC